MKLKQTYALIACALIALLMNSCFSGVHYSIDNPTDQPIEVSIDGEEPIKLGAKEFKKMENKLAEGEHTMKVGDGEEIKFNLGSEVSVMLNPTKSTYVVAIQEYGVGLVSKANDTIAVVDGKEYEGPFPLVSDAHLINTSTINLDVNEPFKDEITTSRNGTVEIDKLFRKEDFIEYFKKEYR